MNLIPTIHFKDNCDEAINFYKEALGAEVKVINYAKDAPADSELDGLPPNFVMYSEVVIFGTKLSFTDGAENPVPYGNHVLLTTFDTEEEVRKVFGKLEEGGRVTEPLAITFWAGLYGEVVDKFGVCWQVMRA